ncbi:5'-3' exoribonuclease 2-like [Dendronephthya gigantea]|uniref:5'-3' exoribonuclease 2-like n=1 Tax=Dendronephthya gigantea TaxID=151771 RepID=UPI00106A3B52|nr:5'-3' exoribonuclease 2-like [Dendronephthya gigantea]
MGVPAFFRWLSKKYPSIVVHSVEEKPREVNDVKIPVDTSRPNPNDVEFDNLYLDMNGIIHPCCHPENKPAPKNEDEMMIAIFEYIDRIFSIVRPRKLLYMAIDGVAPRAKMNQQRSRRFRASKESKDKRKDLAKYREEILGQGGELPPVKEKTEHFDSNCITPGTEFMDNLSVALRYYIAQRLNDDPGWENIKVVLSDANVPGEGEHKIMDFIRKQRASPSHDPNTHHCLNGADADLIMLGLATHEPHFTILREEFKPNQKRPCELCGQVGHDFKDCTGLPKEKQGEFDELPAPVGEDVNFIFIRLNVLREYLERELRMEGLPFPYDFERCLDDWVFMCFFVGNDFLPHLPSLEIREGAIDKLITLYKKCLPVTGGYLTENGYVNLKGVHKILVDLGEMEDRIFKERQQRELHFQRREKEKKARMSMETNRPRWTPAGQYSPQPVSNNPRAIESPRQEAYKMRMEAGNRANFNAAANLRSMLVDNSPQENSSTSGTSDTSSTPSTSSNSAKKDDEPPPDNIRLWEDGWRERYYLQKFGVSSDEESYESVRDQVASAYAEGLCWVLRYYYQGCCSWKWYFPFHYAPFASDFKNIESKRFDFEEGTQPFKPLEQLMSVFPTASGNFLPSTWRELMANPESAIIDFYPTDFEIDLNGKKYAWQGVALLPFVDEKRLLTSLAKVYPDLNEDEKRRNSRGKDRLFVGPKHPACDFFKELYENGAADDSEVDLVTDLTQGMSGKVMLDDQAILPSKCVPSPIPQLRDLTENLAIGIKFEDVNYGDDYVFKAQLLPNVTMPGRVLKPEDWNDKRPYRPQLGFSRNTPRASLDMAGQRMLGFHMKTGGGNASSWDSRNDRRNSYPPPAHVTSYGRSRFSAAGPWPRHPPSHYSNAPGGYSPYQRDAQRHSGNRQHGGYHSQHGGHSQHSGQSQYGSHSQHDRQSQYGSHSQQGGYSHGNSYGRDDRSAGYGRDGRHYDNRDQNDPRRRSTESFNAPNNERRRSDGRPPQDYNKKRYQPY